MNKRGVFEDDWRGEIDTDDKHQEGLKLVRHIVELVGALARLLAASTAELSEY